MAKNVSFAKVEFRYEDDGSGQGVWKARKQVSLQDPFVGGAVFTADDASEVEVKIPDEVLAYLNAEVDSVATKYSAAKLPEKP